MSRLGDLVIEHGPYVLGDRVAPIGVTLTTLGSVHRFNDLRDELVALRAATGQRPTCMCLGTSWPHVPSSLRCTPADGVPLYVADATVEYPHRCPGCGNHYRKPESAAGCDADHRAHAARVKRATAPNPTEADR